MNTVPQIDYISERVDDLIENPRHGIDLIHALQDIMSSINVVLPVVENGELNEPQKVALTNLLGKISGFFEAYQSREL